MSKRVMIQDPLRQFCCRMCGMVHKTTTEHQIELLLDNGSVLPTRPEKLLLKPLCPDCFHELKQMKIQAGQV